MAAQRPLIVIVGPTASGKTGVAVRIAKKLDGEIISADSRAVYRGMDIGTAKPSEAEQDGVEHWGVDLVEPDKRFTVADFQKYANKKIDDIRVRGKIPILVGGSGLYVDSVIYNYNFTTDYTEEQRQELNKLSVEKLQNYCKKHNIELPQNCDNKRYLIRAIERGGMTDKNRDSIREDIIIVGIEVGKDVLMDRISERAEGMFCEELYEETKRLAKEYLFENESMKSNIYPIAWRLINGEIARDEAVRLSIVDDWHLAKKQKTWFRRNPHIEWLPLTQIEEHIVNKVIQFEQKI